MAWQETPYTILLITAAAISAAVIVLDEQNRIVDMNPVAQHAIGHTASETIGQFVEQMWPDWSGLIERSSDGTGASEEVVLSTGDAQYTYDVRLPPIVDWRGRLTSQVIVLRDVTERKRAEQALQGYSERLEEMIEERTQELREAQEQLVRREKLAVLGQLAGGVGHELRNPLGAIKNAAYFLNMVLEEPQPDVKETLEILSQEVATSEKIISSLLDFARTRPPMRRKVGLNDVVRAALSRTAVPEDVEVVSQLDEALPVILADPDQLAQVFGNIILNGVQAMFPLSSPPHAGGTKGGVVVKTEALSPEGVTVSFTDTGVGIPEENLGKLFEPLFTTKAKGIGLGLAIVKALV